MKWKYKGNETQQEYLGYKNRIGYIPSKIWIFGAGKKGKKVAEKIRFLKDEVEFCGFIDNYREKNGVGDDYSIINLSDYHKSEDSIIIVAVSANYCKEIQKQLILAGYKESEDYFIYEEFERYFRLALLHEKNKLLLDVVQLSITERCTLKCKKCAHGCGCVPMNSKDMPLDEAIKSAKALFSIVDYVNEFYIIGGEPLLYKELNELVRFIGCNYRKMINILSITTNATIVPSQELLSDCNKYNVTFHISNYSSQINNLGGKIDKLKDRLDKNVVKYTLQNKNNGWVDYGFDHVNNENEEDKLRLIFDTCKTPCREIRGTKYYFCIQARASAENRGYKCGNSDYLDISQLKGKNGKKILFEYDRGYSERGYLEMCNFCYGSEAEKHPIPAAEQMREDYYDT